MVTGVFWQVSNWFINARVRIWKPMVEEMHMLGDQQVQPVEVNHKASRPVVGPLAALHKPMWKSCPIQNKKKILTKTKTKGKSSQGMTRLKFKRGVYLLTQKKKEGFTSGVMGVVSHLVLQLIPTMDGIGVGVN